MALVMKHTTDNGLVGDYFRISRISGVCAPNEPDPRYEIILNFYASQEIRAKNLDPIAQIRVNVPFNKLPVDPRNGTTPGLYLVLKDYPPFLGQEVVDVVDDSDNLALDVLKAMKIDELNRAWLKANTSYFMYSGKAIAIDEIAHQNIMTTNAYIQMFGKFPDGWPGVWKTMDPYPNETYLTIETLDQWKDFFTAMTGQGVANFGRAQALKKLVNEAITINRVRTITWDIDPTTLGPDVPEVPEVPQPTPSEGT